MAELTETQVHDLLARLGKKDETALRELHQAYAKRIYAFALNRLHDEQEAETVMVDVLYEVWNHPERFRGESRLSTWLLGIAKFKVLMLIRSRRTDTQELTEEMAETTEDESMGVFDTVLNSQHRQHISGCLETLPDVQRESLVLTFYEGWTVGEIAEFQACPEGTAKTRLFHARKNMKGCLEQALGLQPHLRAVPGTGSTTRAV